MTSILKYLVNHSSSGSMKNGLRAQSAVDYVVTYGWALLIIAITFYVLFALHVFNSGVVPTSCYGAPSFSCSDVAITHNGVLSVALTQATGLTINVIGIACSTVTNSVGNGPGTGNLWAQDYAQAPQYYPTNQLQYGLQIATGSSNVLQAYCYNSGNSIAASTIGSSITGYIWLNYTATGLPSSYYNMVRVASFTATST